MAEDSVHTRRLPATAEPGRSAVAAQLCLSLDGPARCPGLSYRGMSSDSQVPAPNSQVPAILQNAWQALGDRRQVTAMTEISANVSTNRVYRVALSDGKELIAKTSSYGSYIHFRQDHDLIHQWARGLAGTRFGGFLARMVKKDGHVFSYRERNVWAVFYKKAPFYDFLPKLLTDAQVDALAVEMAAFHAESQRAASHMPSSWKNLGADIAALYDVLGSASWREEHTVGDRQESMLRAQCETFLANSEELGSPWMRRIPVLVDWNIGNFSVGFDGGGFKLFSRWDYDWFRMAPRVLDFYFCARVVREDGDKTVFSYLTDPFFEKRFLRFLTVYHQHNPIEEEELLLLKEMYRFFVLNYVIRSGEHFFRPSYCSYLQREAVTKYLPQLNAIDFRPLLKALD